MPPFKVVVPARYGSSRLPGKPLLALAGKPMIVHVCERALATGAEQVVVAVDDQRIADAVAGLPVQAVMTSPDHASGTERLVEVVQQLGWDDDVLVVNLQGDEPLMDPNLIRQLAVAFGACRAARVATLAAPIESTDELFDPNVVKVVLDSHRFALYFSRAPVPWARDEFGADVRLLPAGVAYWRHIGIYAYSAGFIRTYAAWPDSPLEQVERLEQLRILWHGERIFVVPVTQAPAAGVDTAEDAHRVDLILRGAGAMRSSRDE
jgi:3-deoxy-manno-octulosonate cytidylyltransferase (CMP-KDO synthetase)